MKKLFLAIAAVATLLASCSKEDGLTGVSKSQVTFTVSSPEMATRAGDYGNGKQATELYYAVYDAVEGGLVSGLSKTTQDNHEQLDAEGKATVSLNLVEGRTYTIIFYAEHNFDPNDEPKKSPYTIDWPNQTLTVDYQNLKANQETYDAFYAHVDNLKVGTAAINETVYLRRPFAQLNVLTNDLDKGTAAGIDIAQTSVTVKNIYTKMNLFTDKVDPASEAAVTYALSDVLKDDNGAIVSAVVDNTTYHWLTMNYLLVNDKKMVDVEFTMQDKDYNTDAGDGKLVRNYTTVPVERNHRTNIYGSIITNPAKFNVEIKPEFLKPDYNVNGGEQYTVTVATDEELQDAINNAKEGRTIITFEKDIDANSTRSSSPATITISQKENVDLVIDGANHKFDGTFYIDGKNRNEGAETLTFININFEHNDGSIDFISSDVDKEYTHNVTIDNCTFTGNDNGDVVGMRFRQAYNVNVVNSTFNKMHSLAQVTSQNNGITFDRVKAENCKSGINLLTSAKEATVKNSDIKVLEYGIRLDGGAASTLVVENSTIEANTPIIVRRVNGENSNNNIILKGQNTLTSTGLYDVVFTDVKDDVDYVPPTGKWSISGAEGLNVYPTVLTEGFKANSSEQLTTLLQNGAAKVNLTKGEYTFPAATNFTAETVINCEEGTVFVRSEKEISLAINGASINGATFKGSNDNGTNLIKGTVNGTFKNCTFEGYNTLRYCYPGEKVEFEGCTFKGYEYAVHFDSGSKTLKFKDCTFIGTFTVGAGMTVDIDNCEFHKDLRGMYNIPNFYDKSEVKNSKFMFDGTATKEEIRLHNANDDATKHIFTNCTVCDSPLADNLNYLNSKLNEGDKVTIDGEVYTFDGSELKK